MDSFPLLRSFRPAAVSTRQRYDGPIYVLDAMTNNAGAAGGALTDDQGRLVGVLGKELRNAQNNTWLNYALADHRPATGD